MTRSLLIPDFARAFWRSREATPFRRHPLFSSQRGHFDPETPSSAATRFAVELTREDSRKEVHRIQENAVTVLGLKRSKVARSDTALDCAAFRYEILAKQSSEKPSDLSLVRELRVLTALNKLHPHFDEIFPYKPREIVVPFSAEGGRTEFLEALEHWEELLSGRLKESVSAQELSLELPTGLAITLVLGSKELLFTKGSVEGVAPLAAAVAAELKTLGLGPLLGAD